MMNNHLPAHAVKQREAIAVLCPHSALASAIKRNSPCTGLAGKLPLTQQLHAL